MSDIANHNWSSVSNKVIDIDIDGHIVISPKFIPYGGLSINKSDSIAIAKHFYSQLETKKEKNAFLDSITSEL